MPGNSDQFCYGDTLNKQIANTSQGVLCRYLEILIK